MPGGFQNIWGPYTEPSQWRALRWALGRLGRESPEPNIPFQVVDAASLKKPYRKYRATWLGHATVLLQSQGKIILTDPIFGQRASPVGFAGPERRVPVPLEPQNLPGLDVVVLSHNHFDHTNLSSLLELQRLYHPSFLVPLGMADLLRKAGLERVVELDWWQYVDLHGHRFSATPVQHFSARSLTDRNETLWTGWYIAAEKGGSFYFGGDTGYGPFFRETAERLGKPDLAILPIGAYEPRWFMKIVHVDPAEAYQAFLDLGARRMLPIHWGTYNLAGEPLDRPIQALREVSAGKPGILDLPVGGIAEE
ncbi:MAG: MBL fold metallo-hydrolase [Spirochaetales bacterium]|nr:MBL fold metallo-hydrolase [Spirochaetales bacterium]